MPDVPPWRLNLLRAFYLLVALGTAFNFGPLVLPWRHVWQRYLSQPAERWR